MAPVAAMQNDMFHAFVGAHSPALTHFYIQEGELVGRRSELHFQDGPIQVHGTNGTTNETVIRLLVARLRSLQEMQGGKFACRENALAITHLEEALHWLEARTAARLARGVEGTSIP